MQRLALILLAARPPSPARAPSGDPAELAADVADPASDEPTADLQRQLAEEKALEAKKGRLVELEEKKSAVDA